MLRYIIMFVLVMTMVKTNAQVPDYSTLQSSESNNKMFITFIGTASSADRDSFIQKVTNDPDFYTNSEPNLNSFILRRSPSSTITKASAIANYISEPYIASVSFMFDDGYDEGPFWGVSNEVLVKVNSNQTLSYVESMANPLGLNDIFYDDYEPDVYHLFFDKTVDIWDACIQLFNSNDFVYAEPNFVYVNISDSYHHIYSHDDCEETEYYTFDQYMASRAQWALFTDQTSQFNSTYMTAYGGTEFSDINVCHAWTTYDYLLQPDNAYGTGVVVAVVDNGVDVRHQDLSNRYVPGKDVIPFPTPWPALGSVPGMPDLFSHHGSWCAGVISAERNNGSGGDFGMVGVAHESKIMPIRSAYYKGPGEEWVGYSSELRAGIVYAYQNGADVINCSWSGSHPSMNYPFAVAIRTAIHDAVTYGRGGDISTSTKGKGCVMVFSAGNDNESNIAWPASSPYTIAVGAMSMCNERKRSTDDPLLLDPDFPRTQTDTQGVSCDGEKWWGSNYGTGIGFGLPYDPSDKFDVATTTSGYLSVVAPGVKIISTDQVYSSLSTFNMSFWGTSSAAPHASGVAALMLSVNPCMEWSEVKDVIELSATKVGSYSYTPTAGIPNGDWNPEMGHGKLNAASAVRLSHDIYKQALTEDGDKTYYSPHKIFAGKNVVNILTGGDYVIPDQDANINFFVNKNESIWLEPGFEAGSSAGANPSVFLAEIKNTAISCTIRHNDYHHYKHGKNNPQTANTDNLAGTQPKLSGLDKLVHGIKIYPNPAKDDINIEFGLDKEATVSFTMTNLVGQTVREVISSDFTMGKQKQSISLQGLAPGVYFVGIKTPSGYSQFRFVKE